MIWSNSTLGELAFFQRGFDITKKEQKDGPYPVVSSSGIQSFHSKATVKGPGVVIGRKGTLGSVFYVEDDFWAHDTTLWVKDFQGNDPKFVYYFLKTLELENFDSGGANPTLNRNHIHGIEILKPSISIQQQIADILSNYDRLIDNNTRRIALLEESIHRLYKEWFVQLRFPGWEKVAIVDGVPEGWRKQALGNICLEIRQGIHPSQTEPDTPYVGLEHIPRQSIALREWGFSRDVDSNKFKFLYKDILFGKIRPYFHKVVIAPVTGICSSDTIVIRPIEEDFLGLVLALVSSVQFVDFSSKTSKEGSKMPRADWKVMKQYPVVVPILSVLISFNDFAIKIVSQVENLIFANQKLREARDLLLPRLMNGSIAL